MALNTNLLTTAYAGHGKIDEQDVKLHLDQLLPQALGLIYIPDHEIPRRAFPGLTNVVAWLTSEVGSDATIPVPDLIEALVSRREYEKDGETLHDDLALVMVYDPENEDDVAMALQAHALGIPVLDLTNAAAEMIFESEEPPFTPDEPAAREETPASGAPSPAEQIAEATEAGIAAAEAVREGREVASLLEPTPTPSLVINIALPPETVAMLAAAIVTEMQGRAGIVVDMPDATPAATAPLGKVSADVATDPQPDNTTVYYYHDAEGKYRLARGRLKAGETRVFLTAEEVAEAKTKNML